MSASPSRKQTQTRTRMLGLVDALRAFQAGDADPNEYVNASMAAARAWEPHIRAFAFLPQEIVASNHGPLRGIPVAVKDLMDTFDMPTECGSPVYRGRQPGKDAWVVSRLRDLGATLLGKSVTTEFAWRGPGPTHNPWKLGYTPGGSSSGSAAAVAAGIVPLALGTQTYGSIIRPAAFCGVVGFKPSYGAIPRTGIQPLAGSLDHVGVFAPCVVDAAFAASLLFGTDAADVHGETVPPLGIGLGLGLDMPTAPRIRVVRTAEWDRTDTEMKDFFDRVISLLSTAGATIVVAELPAEFGFMWSAARTVLATEAAAIFSDLVANNPNEVTQHLKDLVSEGSTVPESEYAKALKLQRVLRRSMNSVMEGFDALITLASPGTAPEGLGNTGDPIFCAPWSFLGAPAIALPAGDGASGLPLGIQLVGKYLDDLHLLQAAAWCEKVIAKPRPRRLPPLPAL
ncbi:putative amidase [Hyaloraphidium curvatum]|nr:putative amidase [Hyaloraphidium curvatum]